MYSVFVYEIHEYLDLEGEQAIIKWFMTLLYDDDGYFRYISTLNLKGGKNEHKNI